MIRTLIVFMLALWSAWAQTQSGGVTTITGGAVDHSAAGSTKPVKTGTATPGTCAVGELFYDTDATAGSNLFGCTATNTWTLLGGVGGGNLDGVTTVTSTATPTLTCSSTVNAFYMVLTANVTNITVASCADRSFTILFVQDGTGGRTVTWPAGFVNPPTVNTTISAVAVSATFRANAAGTSFYTEGHGEQMSAGPLGALVIDRTVYPPTTDIIPTVVPRLAAANIWAGNNAWTPSTSQAITAVGNTILCNANNVQVDPNGTYTLTSTPTIADAANDGTRCVITNLDTALTLTIQDESALASSNLRLGGSNIAIGPRQSVALIYNSTLGVWVREGISAAGGGATTRSVEIPIHVPVCGTANSPNPSFTTTQVIPAGNQVIFETFSTAAAWQVCYAYMIDHATDWHGFVQGIMLPANYATSGQTVTLTLISGVTSVDTGTVGGRIRAGCSALDTSVGHRAIPAPTYGADSTFTITGSGAERFHAPITVTLNLTNCDPGDRLFWEIRRDAGGDFTGQWQVIETYLDYKIVVPTA